MRYKWEKKRKYLYKDIAAKTLVSAACFLVEKAP
jgi:hypothetical protein